MLELTCFSSAFIGVGSNEDGSLGFFLRKLSIIEVCFMPIKGA